MELCEYENGLQPLQNLQKVFKFITSKSNSLSLNIVKLFELEALPYHYNDVKQM